MKKLILLFLIVSTLLSCGGGSDSYGEYNKEKPSAHLETIIYQSLSNGITNIEIPEGSYTVNEPILIDQSEITISGKGNVIIKSTIKGNDVGVFWFKGSIGRKIGNSLQELKKGDNIIYLSKILNPDPNIKYILIRYPNTPDFFEKIGSQVWQKEHPYLRQGIYEVDKVDSNKIILKDSVEIEYPKDAEVLVLNLVENMTIKNLTLIQDIPGANKEEVKYVYENLYPDYSVDAIRLKYVANSRIENVKVYMAGRHVFNCEYCYKIYVNSFEGDGSWNKGGGGNGYFRVSLTYNSIFNNIKLENIRHLTIQSASAKNTFTNLDLKVDINFHGGYSRYNYVSSCKIYIPKKHPWNPITRTPNDAHWGAPDGEENVVKDCKTEKEK